MIVIQRCEFQRGSLLDPMQMDERERDDSRSRQELLDSELLSMTGRNLEGHEIAWVICGQHIRSLNFPLQKVVVPAQHIEKFLISGNSPQVYAVWLRAMRPIPTRVLPPRGRKHDPAPPEDPSRIPVQNMELGTVFGSVPLEKITAGLNRLGYQVGRCTWDELLADSWR